MKFKKRIEDEKIHWSIFSWNSNFCSGATTYAQAPKLEFRVSGFIDAQTFWNRNVPPFYFNLSAGIYRLPIQPMLFTLLRLEP